MTRVDGVVVSGRGRSDDDLRAYSAAIEEQLGSPAHPGTLNLVLAAPLALREEGSVALDPWGKRRVWPSRLGSEPILLYRWRGCPLHVVEVIARRRLRMRPEVGRRETVSFEAPAAPIAPVRWLAWALLWGGRGEWSYTSDRYAGLVRTIDRRLLAAQR